MGPKEEIKNIDPLFGETEQYKAPENKEVVLDSSKDIIKEMKDLTPWEKIKTVSTMYGVEIKEPKKSCNKCYGRGYDGVEIKTQIPVACSCIFVNKSTDKDRLSQMFLNYKQRRKLKLLQNTNSYKKKMLKISKQEEEKLKKDLHDVAEKYALDKKKQQEAEQKPSEEKAVVNEKETVNIPME